MDIKFDPRNHIIQLCMQGMGVEERGHSDEALAVFNQAWNQASNDFEKFIVAYHLGIRQESTEDKLKWLEKSLSFALKINDENVKSAYPTLYLSIAKCYEELNEPENAAIYFERLHSHSSRPTDPGPFYHGTKADLKAGALLTAGKESNYDKGLK